MRKQERPQLEARGVVHDRRHDHLTALFRPEERPGSVTDDLPPGITTLAVALQELAAIRPGLRAALERQSEAARPEGVAS